MRPAFLFQISPYAAIALFVGGMVVRYILVRKRLGQNDRFLDDWRSPSGGVKLLQFSLLLLVLGHLGGLFFPKWVIQWSHTAAHLYTLEALAFCLGLLAIVGWALAMWQHLARSDGSIARQAADAAFLSLLFTLLLSGSLIAVLFRWGSSWGVLTLTPYASSLLRGRPAVGLIADMPFLVQLHVFTAFAIVALLPATRIAPILIAGLSRGLRVMSNLLRTSIEPFGGAVEKMARRLNPASRIWPEED